MQRSPYTPGAGHAPPVLAGRDSLIRDWQLTLNDVVTEGRVRAKDIILIGPRGVGKTVTVQAFAELARQQGFEVVNLQAVSGSAGLIDALANRANEHIASGTGPWHRARRALERIGGVNVSVAGFGGGVTTRPSQPSIARDAGSLAAALNKLAQEITEDNPRGGLLISVDEMQAAAHEDLALLAGALHRLNVEYPQAPVLFTGTGLPYTAEALIQAGVTHPDRLFAVETIPVSLGQADALYAVVEPARARGVSWMPEAAEKLTRIVDGYPAHLQQLAHETWRQASGPDVITVADIDKAIPAVAAQLEGRTLDPRWSRISDRQMEFLAALALHGGRAPISAIASSLGRSVNELSWIRDELLKEGDIYTPRRGTIAISMPLFSRYILANYDTSRKDSTIPLLSLSQMSQNSGVAIPREASLPSIWFGL